MVFATFATGTVLSAGLLALSLATGNGAGIAWFGIGLIFFGYPTLRTLYWILTGGPHPHAAAPHHARAPVPGRTPRADRPWLPIRHYLLSVGLGAIALLVLGHMLGG